MASSRSESRAADIALLGLHLKYNLLKWEDAEVLATSVYLEAFPPTGGVSGGEEKFIESIRDRS